MTDARVRALTAAEVAWIAALPAAILTIAAILVLGPPLGHALFPPGTERLWPPGWWEVNGHAEPVKQGRYALAALAPAALAGVVLAGARRRPVMRPLLVRSICWTAYAAAAALVVVALLEQRPIVLQGTPAPAVFGTVAALVAGALVLAAVLAMRDPQLRSRLAAAAVETRGRRRAGVAIAVAFAAMWLLKSVMTDRLIGDVVGLNLPYTLNDALAVVNGRTPLLDYHVIYAKLLPYPTAAVLSAFGPTAFVYSVWMALLDGLALLAVYAVFRRVARSSLLALGLFLPFVATTDLDCVHISAGVVSPMTLTAMWPMRYGGVYLLAWLTVRHLDERWPRRSWLVFLVAGLVAVNDLEFGAAAFAATAVALACARPPRSARALLRLGASAAVGALGAIALVVVVTLVRAGALPNFALLFEWPRIFTRLGWFAMGLPTRDLHLAIYLTFAAALVLAAVRLSQRAAEPLLTGMLAWSGIFGLLVGGYYVGRPDVLKLEAMLSAWSFAIALLVVACVRGLASRGWRRPTLPELLVLFGFGLSITTLAHVSPPWTQLGRLTRQTADPVYRASAEQFIGEQTHRGETVAVLVPMSYRIAVDLGLRNVAPYGMMNLIVTRRQLSTLVDALRARHVRRLFVPETGSMLMQEGDTAPQQLRVLQGAGFREIAVEAGIAELARG